ncbi:MAG: hypothetical protein AB8B55_01170 [Mariniblastus sp.]
MKPVKATDLNSNSSLEELLSQLPLRRPSEGLDFQVEEVLGEARMSRDGSLESSESHSTERMKFGWSYLIATAIAASLAGFLIGRMGSGSTVNSQVAGDVGSDVGLAAQAGNIKPVTFNKAAFEMLHGHSQQIEFGDCHSCHVKGKDQAFEGWFYGDAFFIRQHLAFGKHNKCSRCHQSFEDMDVDDLFRGHEFEGVAKCSSCHVNGEG